MRSICKTVVIAAMGLLLIPQLAAATDIEAQLQLMQDRMAQMEDRLQATSDQLASSTEKVEEQQQMMEAASLEDERRAKSGLSAFLEQIDINSWLAVSYNYNFEGADDYVTQLNGGQNNGGSGLHMPGYPNHNTFQADQFWLELDKQATEESRAGFHVDLNAGTGLKSGANFDVGIHSAYVSYLAPLLGGILLDVGILQTMIGAEVIQTNGNLNITRGMVWALQPITNTGAVTTVGIGDNFSVAVGILNDPIGDPAFDTNGGKAITSQVKFDAEKFSASAALNWGKEPGNSFVAGGNRNEYVGLLDFILALKGHDNLEAWVNYDFRFQNDLVNGTDADVATKIHAIAAAARLGVTDKTGIAGRFEYVRIDSDSGGDSNAYTLTGTVDHALTENLTAKVEVRWDRTDPGTLISSGGALTETDQVIAIGQLLYEF